jgi:cytochrome c-type biogenesis protein CcmH/NrfF
MRSSVSKIFIALCLAFAVGTASADASPEALKGKALEGKALEGEALDREATNLYQQVFSPFCPGRSLNDCPSSKAAELKDQMRAELEAGKAPEVILNEVIQKFGEQYRAVPRFTGVGMFVWLVPMGFVAIGLLLAVGISMRRKRGGASESTLSAPALSAEDERRIQDELSRLE